MKNGADSNPSNIYAADLRSKYIKLEKICMQKTCLIIEVLFLCFGIKSFAYILSDIFINKRLDANGFYWTVLVVPIIITTLFFAFRLKVKRSSYTWWEFLCGSVAIFLPLGFIFFAMDNINDEPQILILHNFGQIDLLLFVLFIAILLSSLPVKILYIAAVLCFLALQHKHDILGRNVYFIVIHSVVTFGIFSYACWFLHSKNNEHFQKVMETLQDGRLFRKILEDLPECCLIISSKFQPLLYNKACIALIEENNHPEDQLNIEDVEAIFQSMHYINMRDSLGTHFQNITRSVDNILYVPNSEREVQLAEEDFNPSNMKELLARLFMNFQFVYERQSSQQGFFTIDAKKAQKVYEIKLSLMQQNSQNCVLLIISDITQREIMRKANDNEKYKSLLLASFSHELRTPLNGSMSLVQKTIESPEIPENIKEELLNPALNSLRLLLSIINDFLDFSQFKANKLRLTFQETNLRDLLEDIKKLMSFQMRIKGIEFRVKVENELPRGFKTDETRLSQILVNLLSNAMKFTFYGYIEISLNYDSGNDLVTFTVKDSGIGIRQEELNRLKKALTGLFFLDEKVNRNSAGVGLGLTISNVLAKYLGRGPQDGLYIHSEHNRGSNFSFVLENKKIPYFSMKELRMQDKYLGSYSVSSNHSESMQVASGLELPVVPTSNSLGSHKTSKYLTIDFKSYPKKASIFYKLGTVRKQQSSANYLEEGMENTSEYPDPSFKKLSERISQYSSEERSVQLLSKMEGFKKEQEKEKEKEKPVKKILIVDDDTFNLYSLEVLLKSVKQNIEKAHNGREAVDKVLENSHEFTMIIMDCNMPILDGWEATRILKSKMGSNELPLIPIIGCTAYVDEDNLNKCHEYGMDWVVIKPITTQKIINILKEFQIM